MSDYVEMMERRLAEFGDSALGNGWTSGGDETRYDVMLELVTGDVLALPGERSMIDVGCGTARLYERMVERGVNELVTYVGADLSRQMLAICERKFPALTFWQWNLLTAPRPEELGAPLFDYVIVNGVFTWKGEMSTEDAVVKWADSVVNAWSWTRRALAFNVMSTQVDWMDDELLYLPLGPMSNWIAEHLSDRFVVRHDYGLHEYTVYVLR